MPVVVTAAGTPLGRAVVAGLLAADPAAEVRAVTGSRAAAVELGALGARTALLPDLADPLLFGAVLTGAHTLVHLDEPAATWQWTLEAAEDTGLRRIITVDRSGAGAPVGCEVVTVAGGPVGTLLGRILAAERRR